MTGDDSQIQSTEQSSIEAPAKPVRRPSSPNAQSIDITVAEGPYTSGTVNQHPNPEATPPPALGSAATPSSSSSQGSGAIAFRVGVSEDRNKKCRRTMEDAHAFVYDFGGVQGQGYFAVFDGHAGKHAAEWCGANFHKYLLDQLNSGDSKQPIPDLLNQTFHIVDGELSKLAAAGGTHSGCTAVTAFLRLEDEDGNAVEVQDASSFARSGGSSLGSSIGKGGAAAERPSDDAPGEPGFENLGPSKSPATAEEKEAEKKRSFGDGAHREKLKSFFSGTGSSGRNISSTSSAEASTAGSSASSGSAIPPSHPSNSEPATTSIPANAPAVPKNFAKRTLYTANVGDARAVLSRGGKAVRLTYDHKGSDAQEAKRITDAGGFVMNNRVNGVLAVTRSLGDSSMKEFVVGSPYTTETTLGEEDDYLIIACDGLWDVCEDQDAVDLIRDVKDPQEASRVLLDHALQNFSTDNLSVLVVALRPSA